MTKLTAPRGLGARARRFWRDVVAVYEFDRDEVELLVELCHTIDALDVLRGRLTEDGPIVAGSKGQPVEHPAGSALRAHRLVLERLLRRLDLPELGAEDGPESSRSRAARHAARGRWGHGAPVA